MLGRALRLQQADLRLLAQQGIRLKEVNARKGITTVLTLAGLHDTHLDGV